MKKTLLLAAALAVAGWTSVLAQSSSLGTPPQSNFAERLAAIQRAQNGPDANALAPTKFSLDFPGGTPKELVAAIEKASGKPVNAIIFDEDANARLPGIKASDVDVPNLFKTLSENSVKYVNNEVVRNYGFKTIDGRPTDNSLWTFYAYNKPALQTQFSIDFPGGPPSLLVKAIEKAMSRRLNVVINKEDENIELPPLKMENVYLSQLFAALESASRKTVTVDAGGRFSTGSYSQFSASYGFKTADGPVSDASIWYFHVEKPSLPPVGSVQKSCQFYNLSYYLDRGFTVDDVTTAIQTGWRMAGETAVPELNYHKETKLLIAYGDPIKLKTINDVLQTLPQTKYDQPTMAAEIKDLKAQMEQLKKRLPAPASPLGGAVQEEKSGK